MAGCNLCRHGSRGENTYTAWHVDGTLRAFCVGCNRVVSDPHVWVGSSPNVWVVDRHGQAVRFAEEAITVRDFVKVPGQLSLDDHGHNNGV